MSSSPIYRHVTYRGYVLLVLHTGKVQVISLSAPADVICTEENVIAAQRVVDGWIANREQS